MLPSCHPSTIPSWSSPVCFIQLKTFLSIHRHKSRQRLYPIISLYIEMYINRPILMNFKNGLRVWKYVFHIADVTLISFLVSMLFRYHTIIHGNIKVVCSTICVWIKFQKKLNLIRAVTKNRNVDPPQWIWNYQNNIRYMDVNKMDLQSFTTDKFLTFLSPTKSRMNENKWAETLWF